MQDSELYIMRHTLHADMSDAEAARFLAETCSFSYDSVRGRLSRAKQDPRAKKALIKALTLHPPVIPISVQKQLDIIHQSEAEFEAWSKQDEDRRGLFISDLHAPETRFDAYELVLTIADYWQPHTISALNDGADNKGYGRHDDSDPAYRQLWRGDFYNHRAVQKTIHRDLSYSLAENGKLLGLLGNHDRWPFDFWRAENPQGAEKQIADYMGELYEEDGVLMFTRGYIENVIHLSEGLVWVHGYSASKNHMSRAKNALAYFMSDGKAKSVIQGHVHDAFQINGADVGYRGVTFTQNGHLRNNDPEWMHKEMRDWQLAITLCEYNPTKWEHKVHLVPFEQERDMLIARFRGMEWAVKADKEKPL